MSFDERTAPTEISGGQSSVEQTPSRSVEDISNEHVEQQTIIQHVADAENAEHQQDRQNVLTDHLMEIGCLEGFDWNHPAIPDGLVDRLVAFEANKKSTRPHYDLTTKPDVIVKKIAETEWRLLQEVESELNVDDKVRNSDQTKSSYEQLIGETEGGTFDKFQAIIDRADEFPEEAAHVAAFLQMRDMAITPEDTERITAKINGMDISGGIPDPVLFVQSAILTDDSFSESYQDAVAEKFNIPNPRVKTGGQVDQTLDARDANGQPLYTPNNPVPIGDDTLAYENPDGSRVVVVDTGDGRRREIPLNGNESDDVRGLKISLARIWAQNEWDGATDFFGESVDIENDILSQTDPQKLVKVRNTINAVLGGTRGYDAVIVQNNEVDFIGWFNQHISTKGDAAIGDFDKASAVENRTNLGIHPNGNPNEVDYEVLRAAANYAKSQYGTGEPNYFSLQEHLNGLFPDRVPLTEEHPQS